MTNSKKQGQRILNTRQSLEGETIEPGVAEMHQTLANYTNPTLGIPLSRCGQISLTRVASQICMQSLEGETTERGVTEMHQTLPNHTT